MRMKRSAHNQLHSNGPLETLPRCVVNLKSLSNIMDIGSPCRRTTSCIYNRQNSSSVKFICITRKVCRLSGLVHYHPHRVMPSRCSWRVSHKIHCDLFPLLESLLTSSCMPKPSAREHCFQNKRFLFLKT